MPLSFLKVVLLAGSQLVLAADQVPALNVEPTCRAAAKAVVNGDRNEDTCKSDENAARGKLDQEWSQFTSAQKAHCVTLSTPGGSPSYVELLTCLEMAQAAAKVPDTVPAPARPR